MYFYLTVGGFYGKFVPDLRAASSTSNLRLARRWQKELPATWSRQKQKSQTRSKWARRYENLGHSTVLVVRYGSYHTTYLVITLRSRYLFIYLHHFKNNIEVTPDGQLWHAVQMICVKFGYDFNGWLRICHVPSAGNAVLLTEEEGRVALVLFKP